MIDLEHALADLAEHLDVPMSEQAPAALRRRLIAPDPARRTRALLIAAAVLLIMATSIVAIAPARHAVADWLGIGAVEIGRSDGPLPATSSTARHPVPGATGATPDPRAAARLAAARRVVAFAILTPSIDSAGSLAAVDHDRRVPGGLVALSYPRFTLVEIATDPIQPPPLYKLLAGRTRVQQVTVNGEPGLWIPSIHEIGYSNRKGGFALDTVRRSGPVLLWQHAGVTYRIEGLRPLAAAQAVAASLR
jgi:hypothetical protein